MKAAAFAFTFALLACFTASALAAGVNLSWDDCGTAGSANKTFACDDNTGTPFVLVASYVPPAGTTAITGMEVVLDMGTVGPAITDWWQFKNADACRQTALTSSVDFVSDSYVACSDYWVAQPAGGISAYSWKYSGSSCRARLLMVYAMPHDMIGPLDETQEYYAFRLMISRAATVGTGSCAGCVEPLVLLVNDLKLTQPFGVGDYRLQNPLERNFASWQGAGYNSCLFVPTRNSTWGAVKALYR